MEEDKLIESSALTTPYLLNKLLADTFVLYITTHSFHWNVIGENFGPLHSMFGEQYNALYELLDPMAERIRALSKLVSGSLKELYELTSIVDAPKGLTDGESMLMFLLAGHQIAVRTAYSVIEAATKVNDQPTINLVTENIYYHEKVMWQVRACLSKEAHETMSD